MRTFIPILPSRVPSIPPSLIPSSKSVSKLVEFRSAVRRQRGIVGPCYVSGIRASSADEGEIWLLEPIGDGDSRHIGFKDQMPDAFEIANASLSLYIFVCVCFARTPLLPVSFLRKQIWSYRRQQEYLVVTYLDSTNGTIINEKQLRPRVAAVAPPGDIHLAMFLVLKLDDVKPPTDAEESPQQPKAGNSIETSDAVNTT